MRLAFFIWFAASIWAEPTQILARRCLSCHSDSLRMGNLSLTSRAGAERVLESRLLDRVIKGEMPPGGGLPEEERSELKSWILSGAPWQGNLTTTAKPRAGLDWWSLLPISKSAGSIDAWIEKGLKAKGLKLSAAADRRTLLRRVTFDLTGLPPTPDEIKAFLEDNAPTAYEKLIDRLLASPAYGERWGRHWLDVIRYGESHGYEQNHVRPNAWPFRDYVISAFNRDLPFNRFMMEQVAGDVIAPGDPSVEIGTAFIVAGPHDTVGNSNLAAMRQQRADDLDDIVNATASSFLGLTVNCARCHDHKFDPIQQADYYRIAAIFNGAQHGERPIAPPEVRSAYDARSKPLIEKIEAAKAALQKLSKLTESKSAASLEAVKARYRDPVSPFGTVESWTPVSARFVRFEAPAGFAGGLDEVRLIAESGENLAQGAKITVSSTRIAEGNADAYHPRHLNDGAFDKRWFPEGSGPAFIQIELPEQARVSQLAWSTDHMRAFQGKFEQNTVSVYQIFVSSDGVRWSPVASNQNRLPHRKVDLDRLITLESLNQQERAEFISSEESLKTYESELKAIPPLPKAYAGVFKQPAEPVFLLKGGSVMQRGDVVAPASLSAVSQIRFDLPADAPEQERRLTFAKWLASESNPLTPRVIANRVWQHHFGRGIVATPSDFGYNGERPTHPELLDYLAIRLLENGWKLKPLHKEILLSAAYRQASTFDAAAARIDADARLLWRFPPQRLEAEALRDSMLHVAGVLNPGIGGPSFRLYKYTVDNVATYFPLDKFGPETYRRSIYAESARSIRTELLSVFDCPDSSLPEPRRVATTSPLQALSLLNHSFTLDMAQALERRLEGLPDPSRIRQSFLLAFGRPPEPQEESQAESLIARHGFKAFARALFNANEFLYVY